MRGSREMLAREANASRQQVEGAWKQSHASTRHATKLKSEESSEISKLRLQVFISGPPENMGR